MKFGWNLYWHPTPKKIKKIADSLLIAATTISTFSFYNDNKNLAFTVMIVSVIAKFLSNFFAEEEVAVEG
jgi:hypothetical protein